MSLKPPQPGSPGFKDWLDLADAVDAAGILGAGVRDIHLPDGSVRHNVGSDNLSDEDRAAMALTDAQVDALNDDERRNGASGVQAASATVSIEVLRQHWLRAMECDHATGKDKPHCSCSQVDLGWHPSIGAAVEAWLAHVAGVDSSRGEHA